MPIKCVCFPANDPRAQQALKTQRRVCCTPCVPDQQVKREKPSPPALDLCDIAKRTQDSANHHNDFDCHYTGERRQNLINKLKVFLDCVDDRPVMSGTSGSKTPDCIEPSKFGPMIKYPGYVDYDHPAFRAPFDKLPELAKTVGYNQHVVNPCPPETVTVPAIQARHDRGQGHQSSSDRNAAPGGCHCGERRKTTKGRPSSVCKIPSFPPQSPPSGNMRPVMEEDCQCVCWSVMQGPPGPSRGPQGPSGPTTFQHGQGGQQYCCYPIPE